MAREGREESREADVCEGLSLVVRTGTCLVGLLFSH